MGRGREGGDAHCPASSVVGDTWKLCISGMTLIYTIALFFVIGCVALWAWARMYFQQKRTKRFSVGFFHPYWYVLLSSLIPHPSSHSPSHSSSHSSSRPHPAPFIPHPSSISSLFFHLPAHLLFLLLSPTYLLIKFQ